MRTPEEVLENTVRRCRERNIIIPTYREMVDPALVSEGIRAELQDIGLWDLNPRNLFRITWKNEAVETGGGFGGVNLFFKPSFAAANMPANARYGLHDGSGQRSSTRVAFSIPLLWRGMRINAERLRCAQPT